MRRTTVSPYPMQSDVEESAIDIKELIYFFWKRRKPIFYITGTFFLIGMLVVMLSRIEYEASATLLPESQSPQSTASNLLRQYGGLLGISGGGIEEGTTISPSLYPDIVSSLPYQVELMNKQVYFSSLDTTLTIHEYFMHFYPPSAFDYIKQYTIGLPGQIIKLFGSNEQEKVKSSIITNIDRDSVISLSNEQRSTVGKLRNRLIITQEDALVMLTAEFPDPQASAEIGQAGISLLKDYVRDYRTRKANEELKFIREQVNEARERFENVQQKLAEFRDSNINLATAKAKTREQELQSQYDLAFDLYNTLLQNLEQAKLRVQEDTPVLTTVEPFQIPTSNSSPNTKLIIMISLFLGVVTSVIFVLAKKQWVEFRSYVMANEID